VAAHVVGMLADAAERERLGRAGRRWVEQAWTWDVAAAQLRDLLQG
jgi:phosphatidylinositol alpha-1,6-mannosyltransferase